MSQKPRSTSRPRRRRLQFSLGTLLLVVAALACLLGWYSHGLQRIRREQAFLNGRWGVVHEDGSPAILPNGEPIVVTFNTASYTVDPSHEPKRLDFHVPGTNQVSKCIYRREGRRVRICQVSPGAKRPERFGPQDPIPEPVSNPTARAMLTVSSTEYLLVRIPDEKPAVTQNHGDEKR